MYVINRQGEKQSLKFDKITDRNIELAHGLDVDPCELSQHVIKSLKNGMTTNEIDVLSAETSTYMSTYNPDYDTLAVRIAVSNLHKSTIGNYKDTLEILYKA